MMYAINPRCNAMKEYAMSKAAAISEIEHKIEALQPADQLKLLERMVRHLKLAFTGQPQAKRRKTAAVGDALALRGALKQYAAPEFRELESEAFLQAMKEKHALRRCQCDTTLSAGR
jgi:hypothetical protein